MRKKLIIIVNPVSGKGVALEKAGEAKRILRRVGVEADLIQTRSPGHARQLSAKWADCADVLISVGGDGTLNELVNGVVDAASDTPIAVIPTGTANVVARELGLPKGLEAQVMIAAEGPLRRLDLGRAGDRCFAMCAGAGFDAAVVKAVSERRTRLGISMFSYVIPVIREALGYPYPAMRVLVDGAVADESASFVVVANMGLYGGVFRLFNHALPDDGRLDVRCFRGKGVRDLFRYAWAAYWGRLDDLMDVSSYQGTDISLEADKDVPIQIDGDPGGNLPVSIVCLPKAVSFCTPR
ncbi:MAG: diacylglycerol/lipid kinase family protein [Desulfatiglandales bacterium]